MTTLAASTLALTNLTVDTLADTDEVRLARDVSGTAASRAATLSVLRSNVMKYGIWPRSSLEIAASVTPSDYGYPPGDVRRYGADPTGVADSSAAWIAACKSGHVVLGGGAYTYKFTTFVTLTTSVRIDLQGATLKPTGNTDLFRRYVSTTASTTVSAGATKGSRDVTVASATGIAIGQWARLVASDYATSTVTMTIANPCVVTWTAHGLYAGCPISFTTTGALPVDIYTGVTYYVLSTGLTADTFQVSLNPEGTAITTAAGSQSGMHTAVAGHDAASYPAFWAKITDVSGTNIEFERPLPLNYYGTKTLVTYAASTMLDTFQISNGTIDGALSTSAIVGEAIRVALYESVRIDCDVVNFTNDNASTYPVSIVECLDVQAIGQRTKGQTNRAVALYAYQCRSFKVIGCDIDTDSFGAEGNQCETVIFEGNTMRGRRNKAIDDSLGDRSVRGFKTAGCYSTTMANNHVSDFDSPIKVQAGFRVKIIGNTITKTNDVAYNGEIALSVGSIVTGANMVNVDVSHNTIDGGYSTGIGVGGDDPGRGIIAHNHVIGVKGNGIWAPPKNMQIENNRIDNWGLNNPVDSIAWEAIYHGARGGNITGNRFSHSTLTSLPCIRNLFGNGYKWVIENNTSEGSNPLGAVFENSSLGQIASGATSTTITHGLSTTPNIADIIITPNEQPTNPPGLISVDTPGATTFVVRCAANPGASNLDFGWKAKIRMPVTA